MTVDKLGNTTSGPHAMVCSYHTPQPDRDSGARRIFDFIGFLLDAGWKVTFLASDGAAEEADNDRLRQRGVAVYDGVKDDVRVFVAAQQFDLALIAFWLNAERDVRDCREVSPATRVLVDSVRLALLVRIGAGFSQARQQIGRAIDEKHAARMIREIAAAADGVAGSRKGSEPDQRPHRRSAALPVCA